MSAAPAAASVAVVVAGAAAVVPRVKMPQRNPLTNNNRTMPRLRKNLLKPVRIALHVIVNRMMDNRAVASVPARSSKVRQEPSRPRIMTLHNRLKT